MNHAHRIQALILVCLLVAGGCSEKASPSASPASSLPTVRVQLGNKPFNLEVANNEETREYGLMRRDSMPSDHGMIFVFDKASNVGFYMKNTRIPLDIVFVDSDGGVISIKQMKPYDLSTTWADGQAKWAIELNLGAAAGAGVKVGDKLQIPESARNASP